MIVRLGTEPLRGGQAGVGLVAAIAILISACASAGQVPAPATTAPATRPAAVATLTPTIARTPVLTSAPPGQLQPIDVETHVADDHLQPSMVGTWATSTIKTMDATGVSLALLAPTPNDGRGGNEEDLVRAASALHPDRFAFVSGGGSLNPLIQEAVRSGGISADLRGRFEAAARSIAQSGAKAYGELAALHFSFTETQPYEVAPPDHPLFLLLADIAAQAQLPIDLHMEAVVNDMQLPSSSGPQSERFTDLDPPRLAANVAAFERLLDHAPQASIVWEQTGWDHTGDKTVALLRRLLQAHPNLYLAIKIRSGEPRNSPLGRGRRIVSEWRELIEAFPQRFVLGSDTFFGCCNDSQLFPLQRELVDQLSPSTAAAVASGNAIRLYRLR